MAQDYIDIDGNTGEVLAIVERQEGTLITLQQYKDAILSLEGEIKSRMLRIGKLLTEVAELLKHDRLCGLELWVERELKWDRRTAYNYRRVYERFGNTLTGKRISQLAIPQSGWYELASDHTPEEARQEILERAEEGEQLSLRFIQQTIRSHRVRLMAAQQAGKVAPMPAPTPSTLCACCHQGNIPVYAFDKSGVGICLTCAQQAVKYLSK